MRENECREAWEMKPRKLTPEEIEQPGKVLEDFFQYAHLPQLRTFHWEALKTMITGNFAQLKCRERINLIYFYEQMEKLVEVAHVLYESGKIKPQSLS